MDSLFNFAVSFNALGLHDTGIGLFSAAVLFTPDRMGVMDRKSVQFHQDRALEALRTHVSQVLEACSAAYSYATFTNDRE